MDVPERTRGDRRRLARLIAKESDAVQRDRLRSVLLVLQGRQALEVAGVVGRSRRFVQHWAYAYRDGGIEAVRGRTAPGRQRRLSPEQEARFVERVKAGATPRDGVASLRGPQIQGILDREFGKTFSLNGIYKLLNRHGLVCLKPRPRHPRQDPAAAKAFGPSGIFMGRAVNHRSRSRSRP
jgi:transposase